MTLNIKKIIANLFKYIIKTVTVKYESMNTYNKLTNFKSKVLNVNKSFVFILNLDLIRSTKNNRNFGSSNKI